MRKLTLAVFLFLAVPAFARHHRPAKHNLFPTHGSLALQNAEASRLGLARVKNDAMLAELVKDGSLVPLPTSAPLRSTIPAQRAYLRPWAAETLADIASDEYLRFNRPLTVSSAVRPVTLQRRLWRARRVPAAPADGPVASVHPAGIAFDLGKKSLTTAQRRWLEWRLFYLMAIGRVIVEEERACFHVVAVAQDGPFGTVLETPTTSLQSAPARTYQSFVDAPSIYHTGTENQGDEASN